MPYPVALKVDRPEKLSRLTTFFRFFMVIPQAIVFVFVSIAAYIIYFLSWWGILFTGNYPQTFFKFVTWWFRWSVGRGGGRFVLPGLSAHDALHKLVLCPIGVEVET